MPEDLRNTPRLIEAQGQRTEPAISSLGSRARPGIVHFYKRCFPSFGLGLHRPTSTPVIRKNSVERGIHPCNNVTKPYRILLILRADGVFESHNVESPCRADRYKVPNNLVPLKPKFVVQDAKSR